MNQKYELIMAALATGSCCLSICGVVVIFGTFIAIPEIRNFTRKLILCLSTADFLTASGYLLSTTTVLYGCIQDPTKCNSNGTVCEVQSAITTYSSLVSFFLTIAIGGYLLIIVVYKQNVGSCAELVSINLVCWLIPGDKQTVYNTNQYFVTGGIILAALLKEMLGGNVNDVSTGPWCWVRDSPQKTTWMWITGKSWEILCYLLTVSFYVLLKLYIYLKHRSDGFGKIHVSLRDEDQNFLYVWLILYILRFWGTIRFIISVFQLSNNFSCLPYLQAIGDPGQGFCNCILFCFLDKTVRSKMFPCSRRSQFLRL